MIDDAYRGPSLIIWLEEFKVYLPYGELLPSPNDVPQSDSEC